MKNLLTAITLIVTSAILSVSAQAQSEEFELKTTNHILGPLDIANDQELKICMTDIADLSGATSKSLGDEKSLIQTQVIIFSSQDTSRPIAKLDGKDLLVWKRQTGTCTTVAGYNINRASLGIYGQTNSIIAVIESVTEGASVFQPIVTGQLKNPDSTSAVALLLPAVQAAREAARRPSSSN